MRYLSLSLMVVLMIVLILGPFMVPIVRHEEDGRMRCCLSLGPFVEAGWGLLSWVKRQGDVGWLVDATQRRCPPALEEAVHRVALKEGCPLLRRESQIRQETGLHESGERLRGQEESMGEPFRRLGRRGSMQGVIPEFHDLIDQPLQAGRARQRGQRRLVFLSKPQQRTA